MTIQVPDWTTETKETPCGGQIQVSVSKEYSTVNCKFVEIVIGPACESCPFSIFCRNNFIVNGAKPAKPKAVAAPPKVEEVAKIEKKAEPPKQKPEKTVKVVAFTGMRIGELEVVKENASIIEVATARGLIVVFDKATGVQTNCLNPKYANRIVTEWPAPAPVKEEEK